jgi:enoyl-CoA hydratase/carnithine racemase
LGVHSRANLTPSRNKDGGEMSMPVFQTLKTRTAEAVLFAEIDSPPLNMIGPALVSDLISLIELLDRGEPYRVVVFSSSDPDFFISHADVTKIAEYREAAAKLTGEPSLGLMLRRLSETRAVTIAQIAGRTRGAGSEFILACDMRFASRERAVFGQIEAGTGVAPGAGAMQHLARLMGRGRALEVLLSADDFDAGTAERYGWINRALPDASLAPFVAALAERIARFPLEGLMAIKNRINAVTLADAADFRTDSDLFGTLVREPAALLDSGMQTRGVTELNFGRVLGEIED